MLTAGWAADTLNTPGKFLLSTPEHTTPRRARAYRVDDHDVATIVARHTGHRPQLDALSRDAITPSATTGEDDVADEVPAVDLDDPTTALCAALLDAPETGRSVRELMTATGMGRTWVYARRQELAADGRASQVSRGRWTVTRKPR